MSPPLGSAHRAGLRPRLQRWTLGLAALLAVVALRGDAGAQSTVTERLDARIQALEQEATALARSARTLVNELRALEIDRDLRTAEAAQAEAALAESTLALDETAVRLEALERERDAQLPAIRTQLVELYKHGHVQVAGMLFTAGDVRALGRAVRAATALLDSNRRRLDAHQQTLAALRTEEQDLEHRRAALQAREQAARTARASAQSAVRAHASRIRDIDARRDLTAQYVGELQVARDALLRRLSEAGSGSAVRVPLQPFRGALEWPVQGRLIGRFGQSANRLGGTAVRSGVEIDAVVDTPVRAVHEGRVVHAGPFTGFGQLVIVDHGQDDFSLYGYLSQTTVDVGNEVQSRTELGRVGSAPAGPAALYFELRIDGRAVDPVQWLESR